MKIDSKNIDPKKVFGIDKNQEKSRKDLIINQIYTWMANNELDIIHPVSDEELLFYISKNIENGSVEQDEEISSLINQYYDD